MKKLLLTTTLALAGGALAYAPVLSAAQVTLAAQQGAAMVTPKSGYLWGQYLIKSYSTGIKLADNSPEVDGIAMGTPFERLRYEAYLSNYEEKPLTPDQATTFARTQDNKLTFVIYTHSLQSVDEDEEEYQQAYNSKPNANPKHVASYLDVFKTATLKVDGTTLNAQPMVDGPYTDEFNLANGDFDFRFLGVITYVFNMTGHQNAKNAVFSFKDSKGNNYTQSVVLANFR